MIRPVDDIEMLQATTSATRASVGSGWDLVGAGSCLTSGEGMWVVHSRSEQFGLVQFSNVVDLHEAKLHEAKLHEAKLPVPR